MSRKNSITLDAGCPVPEVFGVNDVNISIFEELLDVPVFTKGNELYIDSDDDDKHAILCRLLDELQKHARNGQIPTPDLIRSIHAGLSLPDTAEVDLLRTTVIAVPGGFGRIFPRTPAQARYIKAIQELGMVFGIGPAGTGKTYLAVAGALEEVVNRRKRKLVLTRPVVEAGESLGFLPGDLTQKLNPYLRPLYDAMESIIPHELICRLQENGAIEIAPLAYMRGRSLKNCVVILDEAQNTTREQMKMFLTRLGEDSKAIITGDVTQIDLPAKSSSGLVHAAKILRQISEIHFSSFSVKDVIRNPLIRKIIDAYESDR